MKERYLVGEDRKEEDEDGMGDMDKMEVEEYQYVNPAK